MRSSKNICSYKSLLILCLLAIGTCLFSSLLTHASQIGSSQESHERFPGKGLRILKILAGSLAEQAGLKEYDLLFRYGEFVVADDASYFVAREAYENGPQAEIPILVWRDGKALRLTVGPGRLGIESNEYGDVAYDLSTLLTGLDIERYAAKDKGDPKSRIYAPLEKSIKEVRRTIDRAERESTLTPTQILVARIYMIPDDASPEDLSRQSEMLEQLISAHSATFIAAVGQHRFFENKHNRAAVECFKRFLEVHPDEAEIRLNMGVAYYRLRMYAEVEAAADYVLGHEIKLSNDNHGVAYNLKAVALLSRGEYEKSIVFAEKAFDLDSCYCDISLAMLAAAQIGNLQKLAELSRKFHQALPEEFEKMKLPFAAVEAYALVKSNQPERARAVVQKFKNVEGVERLLRYHWTIYPGSSDLLTNWKELTAKLTDQSY
jgi:tetratricopeptide (TPR) repeat protein